MAECRTPAPVSAHVVSTSTRVLPGRTSKKGTGPVGAGRPTGWNRGQGPLMASLPSSLSVLHARLALLDSSTNNFFRKTCLSMLHSSIQVRERPGQVVLKLADGKLHSVARRELSLPYTYDDFAVMMMSW